MRNLAVFVDEEPCLFQVLSLIVLVVNTDPSSISRVAGPIRIELQQLGNLPTSLDRMDTNSQSNSKSAGQHNRCIEAIG